MPCRNDSSSSFFRLISKNCTVHNVGVFVEHMNGVLNLWVPNENCEERSQERGEERSDKQQIVSDCKVLMCVDVNLSLVTNVKITNVKFTFVINCEIHAWSHM